jgi:hypothetical protein
MLLSADARLAAGVPAHVRGDHVHKLHGRGHGTQLCQQAQRPADRPVRRIMP